MVLERIYFKKGKTSFGNLIFYYYDKQLMCNIYGKPHHPSIQYILWLLRRWRTWKKLTKEFIWKNSSGLMLPISTALMTFYHTYLLTFSMKMSFKKSISVKIKKLRTKKSCSCMPAKNIHVINFYLTQNIFLASLPSPELFLWRENVVYVY